MAIDKVLDNVKIHPLAAAVIVTSIIIGFFVGVTLTKIQSADEIQKLQHEHALKLNEHAMEMQKIRYEVALLEVGGLRSDMMKEDAHLQKQIDELKSR